jgi:tetratricopeptide (TPR) repeat protein
LARKQHAAWIAAAVFPAAALALYWGTLRHPLVFDDLSLVQQALQRGGAAASPGLGTRALSEATFGWIQGLLGANLAWQRLFNVLLHGAVGAALFGFLARLFKQVLGDSRAPWTAFLCALAFLLHPVAVYGVAYLAQRSILMATLFSVLSLWCVLEGLLRGSARWHVAAAAAYLLAVYSKEHAVMLPAVVGAMVLLLRGASLETLRRFAPASLLFAATAAVVIYQARALIGAAYEPFAADVMGIRPDQAYALSVLNQGFLFFRYLLTWLLPCPCWMSIDLRVAFPAQLLAWPQSAGFIAFLAYPLAAIVLLLRGGRLGLLGFGLLYPWLLALTEFAAVRAQEPFVLYRSYLWMSGLPVIFAALTADLSARVRHAVLGAACLALIPLALNRLDTFSDPLKLWDDAVGKNTDLRAAYVERAYANRGEQYRGAGRADAALADFERAIALNPQLPAGYVGRATLRLSMGQAQQALPDLDRAIALDAGHASAHAKRCMARAALGQPQALADCERAIALDPSDPESWTIAGIVHRSLGQVEAAAANFRRALQLAPNDPVIRENARRLLQEQKP